MNWVGTLVANDWHYENEQISTLLLSNGRISHWQCVSLSR